MISDLAKVGCETMIWRCLLYWFCAYLSCYFFVDSEQAETSSNQVFHPGNDRDIHPGWHPEPCSAARHVSHQPGRMEGGSCSRTVPAGESLHSVAECSMSFLPGNIEYTKIALVPNGTRDSR